MSAATIIATIDSTKIAKQLIDELLEAGFKDQDVEILDGDKDALVAEIVERGFGQDDARGYAEAASRGKTVVATRAAPEKAEKAAAIMERYETAEGESSHEQGETGQEVEEELSVGKRKVASGGARVTTSVSERPVEKTVTLREEEVEVERRPADRKLKPEEAEAAFQDKTVEMLGTSEGRGPQAGTGDRRGLARQAGRGARGDGQGHRAPQRGRGRDDQAQLRQEALNDVD